MFGDVYYCFTAFFDVEQQEAGDTLTHTFTVSPWYACETRYFYFHGEVSGVPSPSTTPIIARHLFYTNHSYVQQCLNPDDVASFQINTLITTPPDPPLSFVVGRGGLPADLYGGAWRFRSLQLPPFPEILSANMTFVSLTGSPLVPVNSQFSVEPVQDPDDFFGILVADFWARWATRALVTPWDNIPPWAWFDVVDSPDIAPLVQLPLSSVLWKAGNAIVLFWEDFLQRTPWQPWASRTVYTMFPVPWLAPFLSVNYNHWHVEEIDPWAIKPS
jgi:hypothetical protein